MGVDPSSLGIGFAIGWVVNWSYDRWHSWLLRRKRGEGDYFTATYSSGYVEFEGRAKTRVSTQEILKSIEQWKSEPAEGDEG